MVFDAFRIAISDLMLFIVMRFSCILSVSDSLKIEVPLFFIISQVTF